MFSKQGVAIFKRKNCQALLSLYFLVKQANNIAFYNISVHLKGQRFIQDFQILKNNNSGLHCKVCEPDLINYICWEQYRSHVTHDILHNIAIKIYCDKNIFGPWMYIGQGKLLTKHKTRHMRFFKSLPLLGIEAYVSKLLNIIISFFITILCEKNVSYNMGQKEKTPTGSEIDV